MNNKKQKVGIINLGCARNLVDSQIIIGNLKKKGHEVLDVDKSDIVLVNTCGFIEDAKRESIDTILDLIELKKEGKLKKIVVAGCLSQRYAKELGEEFKEIDAIVGVQKLDREKVPEQVSLTPNHFAYIKICESCYNNCNFCAIPSIKGKFSSRTMESILEEIKLIDKRGVKEINIIGQDITAYGVDIYKEKSLAKLLKEIVSVCRNIQWIRLLYAFPSHITDELIDVIAGENKICKYMDIPLQHINDNLLKSMNRDFPRDKIVDLIEKIRKRIPDVILRTSFIVGFPNETDEEFSELMDFIKEIKFEKVGVFMYSQEEGTKAYDMLNQVSDKIKKKRFDELMSFQQDLSKAILKKYIGRTLKVLVDEKYNEVDKNVNKFKVNNNNFIYIGRTEYDAPEVDGVVYIHSKKQILMGDFVKVNIVEACEYDLIGEC